MKDQSRISRGVNRGLKQHRQDEFTLKVLCGLLGFVAAAAYYEIPWIGGYVALIVMIGGLLGIVTWYFYEEQGE